MGRRLKEEQDNMVMIMMPTLYFTECDKRKWVRLLGHIGFPVLLPWTVFVLVAFAVIGLPIFLAWVLCKATLESVINWWDNV